MIIHVHLNFNSSHIYHKKDVSTTKVNNSHSYISSQSLQSIKNRK